MSYLKKIGALFVSSALMASMLAGCGSSSDSTGGNGSQAEGGDGNYNISIVFKTTSNPPRAGNPFICSSTTVLSFGTV